MTVKYIIKIVTETTSFADTVLVSLLHLVQAYGKYMDIYMCGCRTLAANDLANAL